MQTAVKEAEIGAELADAKRTFELANFRRCTYSSEAPT